MNLVGISNGKPLHVPYRDSKLTFLLQVYSTARCLSFPPSFIEKVLDLPDVQYSYKQLLMPTERATNGV